MNCPQCKTELGKEVEIRLKLSLKKVSEVPDDLTVIATQKWVCPSCALQVEVPERFDYSRMQ